MNQTYRYTFVNFIVFNSVCGLHTVFTGLAPQHSKTGDQVIKTMEEDS